MHPAYQLELVGAVKYGNRFQHRNYFASGTVTAAIVGYKLTHRANYVGPCGSFHDGDYEEVITSDNATKPLN